MQKHEFTYKVLCTYVLYWAMEEGETANTGLYKGNELASSDCDRLNLILENIKGEGRVVAVNEKIGFIKTKE